MVLRMRVVDLRFGYGSAHGSSQHALTIPQLLEIRTSQGLPTGILTVALFNDEDVKTSK